MECATTALKAGLQRRKTQSPSLALIVEALDDADYQSLIDVLDLIQELGISQAGLSTREPPLAQ